MPNNPNDPRPDPHTPPNDKGSDKKKRRPDEAELPESVPFGQLQEAARPEDARSPDSVPIGELPPLSWNAGLSDPELYLADPKNRGTDPPSGVVNPRATPESVVFENLKSPNDSSLFESLKPDSSVFENLKPDSDESLFGAAAPNIDPTPSNDSISDLAAPVPPGESVPAPGVVEPSHDREAAVGNLEPLAPVSPASGWIDSDEPPGHPGFLAEPLAVEDADLFEAPPAVESSDIFSSGSRPPHQTAGGSDVIAATAHGDKQSSQPETPERASDVALSFDQPPGGSTIESNIGSGDLPVAEPVSDSELFGQPGGQTNDAPLYGSTPEITSDTSSILADLANPGDVTIDDSSAIRLEAPGVQRTSHPSSGTEFDLTIGDGEVPPELAEAAEAAETGAPSARFKRPASDPDTRTVPEMNISEDQENVQPVDSRLRPDDPSSIFDSINDPVVFRRPGETDLTDDDDAAVDFSDHPDAEPGESSSSSSLFGSTSPPGRRIRPRPASEADFELPAEPASGGSGVLDWKQRDDEDEESRGASSDILLRGGKPSQPPTEPVPDQTSPTRAAPLVNPVSRSSRRSTAKDDSAKSDSVEVDWVAGSSTEEPVVESPSREDTPSRKMKAKKDRPAREPGGRKKGGMLSGALVGAGVAIASCAGIYFSGVIPNKPKQIVQSPPPPANTNPRGGTPDGGNHGTQPPDTSVPGQSRLFAKIQELGKLNSTVAAVDDVDLKKAREELEGVAHNAEAAKTAKGEWEAVQATIYLGISHQIANEHAAARKLYEAGMKKFPKYAATFQGALDRLDATNTKPDGVSRRLAPAEAEQLVLAVVLLQPPPAPAELEAGVYFWKAVKLARDGKYAEASTQIALAKAAHIKQAKVAPGGGLNPLSDPLHEIFPRSCDDLKAYWDLRAAIYSNKAVAALVKKDGAAKALTELARRADTAVTLMADLKTTTDKLTRAQSDYKDASARLAKAEGDFKDASAKLTRSEKDLLNTKNVAVKFEKDYKAAEAARLDLEKKLTVEATARASADGARKKGDELIATLARELQAAKLLPAKYDTEALLAAQRSAAIRATGPTLNALIPSGMMAIGGGGLAAGQLADIAERLTKAESAAKAATTRLATETKRLREEHAVAVKKMTDGYAAETKKLMEAYATSTTKLKDDHAAEVKTMADKFVADMKKLIATYDAKVNMLEASVAVEKKAAEALAAKFKVDLGAAMSPAQALDVWLPLLTDLRRSSDADAALATATRVLATAPNESEDSAKARTVAGLAHFLKGDMTKARELFVSAKASPAYRTAADKAWARAADVGLQSINDPLATYRRPVHARQIDPRAAARFLDAGMKAYRNGRYADAVAALGQSVKADPSEPLAWYFLGAAKWETVGAEEARKEFEQGAEQERLSLVPARTIGDLLSSIQGPVRDALTAARP